MSARTLKQQQQKPQQNEPQPDLIDESILKQQEEISMTIQNLVDEIAALSTMREANRGAQGMFTSGKLKEEKKVLYLASNNFIKMSRETAFKSLEKDQSKVMAERKKAEKELQTALAKLAKLKPYFELLDIEIAELLTEHIKDNEDNDD